MGTVWRAHQLSSAGRVVAVKRVHPGDPGLVQRIRREAEALLGLDHPHVVSVHELVPDGEGVAIVMAYAPGGSLADLLGDLGRLEPQRALRIALPLAEALASVHRCGVLHRDVTPGNVLFTSDGQPLLGDFGLAFVPGGRRLSGGGIAGTAEYLDPDVAGGAEPDPSSDVYGLAVLTYEMLAGGPPFTGPTPLAVLRAADLAVYTPLVEAVPGVPRALAGAVERGFARDRAQRFASAEEFAAALRGAAGQTGPEPRPAPPVTADASKPATVGAPRQTRTFGPKPVVREQPPARERTAWRKPVVVVTALFLLASPVALMVLLTSGDGNADTVQLAPVAPTAPLPLGAQPRTPAVDCRPPAAVDGDAVDQHAVGLVELGGCPVTITTRRNTVTVHFEPDEPPVELVVGDDGDRAVVGDWNCDGTYTPGVYRPDTGQVFLFAGWATVDSPRVYSAPAFDSDRRGGEPRVRDTSGDGCDDVDVAGAAPGDA